MDFELKQTIRPFRLHTAEEEDSEKKRQINGFNYLDSSTIETIV